MNKLMKKDVFKYIESNNRLYSLIQVLNGVLENPKFIHITRDGRDIVRSGMSRKWYEKDDPFPRIAASHFPDDPYFDEWDDMNKFEKICWWWQKKDGIILNSLKNIESSIRVKFEDIFSNETGLHTIEKIISFLNISLIIGPEIFKRKINVTKKYSFPKKEKWDANINESFNRISGDLMKYYGYTC